MVDRIVQDLASAVPQTGGMPDDAQESIESAVATVDHWLRAARAHETARSRRTMRRLRGMVHDPGALAFVMDFIDRVARPDDDRAGARQLHAVVVGRALPPFLGRLDRLMLRAGARIGPALPGIVMPLARRRMRAIVGHLVAPAEVTGETTAGRRTSTCSAKPSSVTARPTDASSPCSTCSMRPPSTTYR